MRYAIGHNFDGKALDGSYGFVASGAVCRDAWQFDRLCYPAPVFLTVEFDRQPHEFIIRLAMLSERDLSSPPPHTGLH